MGKAGSAITHFNSTVRTLLMAVVVGVLGFGGFQAFQAYSTPRRELAGKQRELDAVLKGLEQAKADLAAREQAIAELKEEVAERDVRIDQLLADLDRVQTAVKLLKLRRRLARMEVLDQTTADDGTVSTKILFTEIGDNGQRVGEPAELTIDGDRVYVEYLVVKFDDKYVEQADLERGTAICLLERIFGENQEPGQGFVIDQVGSRPNSYERGSITSDFEQQIWNDFWTIANDRQKAADLGIRATHAQAPSMRVEKGATYELDLRSTGEFSLQRME
jgi:hypothetical protein